MKNFSSLKFTLSAFIAISSLSSYASQDSTRIIGGETVNSQDTIAQQTVGLFMESEKGASICSGEIIDDSHILTAAHCVNGIKAGYVVFSTGDITQVPEKYPSKVRAILSAKVMPGYNGQSGGAEEFADFGIISFSGGIPSGYEPAHFLPKKDVLAKLKASNSITLAGYGITSAPSEISRSNPSGAGTLRKVDVKLSSIGAKKINMVVQGPARHIACSGDSGGPALITHNGDSFVVGVASRSNCQNFSIYSIVSKELVSSFVDSVSSM